MLFRILLGLLFAGGALAQDYPSRPVKIIVPYAPGGSTDIIGRIVAQRLTESLGQSFLVDNRPGASGNLALEAVAKAPPDGYTLLVGNVSTNAINENTFAQQLSIKPSRDLVGVAKLIEIPHIVAAAPSFPPSSIAELIAEARRNPGRINYASAGLGSYPHPDMEKLKRAAGIDAKASSRQALQLDRGEPVAPRDERASRQADADRHARPAAGVHRVRAQGDAGLGRVPARGEDQDRVALRTRRHRARRCARARRCLPIARRR